MDDKQFDLQRIAAHLKEINKSHKRIDRIETRELQKFIGRKLAHLKVFMDVFRYWQFGRKDGSIPDDIQEGFLDLLAFLLNEIGDTDVTSQIKFLYGDADNLANTDLDKLLKDLKDQLPLLRDTFIKIKDDKAKIRDGIVLRSALIANGIVG
jgi:hypothetical protein